MHLPARQQCFLALLGPRGGQASACESAPLCLAGHAVQCGCPEETGMPGSNKLASVEHPKIARDFKRQSQVQILQGQEHKPCRAQPIQHQLPKGSRSPSSWCLGMAFGFTTCRMGALLSRIRAARSSFHSVLLPLPGGPTMMTPMRWVQARCSCMTRSICSQKSWFVNVQGALQPMQWRTLSNIAVRSHAGSCPLLCLGQCMQQGRRMS